MTPLPIIDVGLDFETYYDSDYTLTKLTTIEYILDPRFQTIGFSLRIGNTKPVWYSGDYAYLHGILDKVPWHRCRVIAHNVMFDGGILEWIFGFQPHSYFCTMMGARPYVTPHTGRTSLAVVMKFLGTGTKGNEVEHHRGRRREAFTKQQLYDYGVYCCDDTDGTVNSYLILKSWLPEDEQYLIDLTLKKFLRPTFLLDNKAIGHWRAVINMEHGAMSQWLQEQGTDKDSVVSRPKFAALLAERGVKPPMKVSKATKEDTYAFAKTDDEFMLLKTHDDPIVQGLVEARLMFSSSIERTRFERFQRIYDLNLGGDHRLPVPLLYYAAHPGRFGGTDSLNLQNMPRPSATDPRKGALRSCLIAPPGHVVLAADFSNIEARIVATLAKQTDLIRAFRNGEDIYSQFASRIYGRPINKHDHPIERFVGKTCILGFGYGMGWMKFALQIALAGVKMDNEFAKKIVYLYRDTYSQIPNLWTSMEQLAHSMTNPKTLRPFGPVTFAHERILLPNGMPISYPGVKVDKFGTLSFVSKRKKIEGFDNSLWGGVVTENVTQALARIIATRAEIRLARGGLPAVHQAHDELIWIVPELWVEKVVPLIERTMTDTVPWLPHLPIAVEIKHGRSYADCK